MAYQIEDFNVGVLPANVDLTGSQFLAVEVIPATATVGTGTGGAALGFPSAGGVILGILQNNPQVGEAGEVAVSGVSKAVAGAGSITIGALLMAAANGKLIPATAGNVAVAQALESASSGDVFAVLVKNFGKQ